MTTVVKLLIFLLDTRYNPIACVKPGNVIHVICCPNVCIILFDCFIINFLCRVLSCVGCCQSSCNYTFTPSIADYIRQLAMLNTRQSTHIRH